MRINDSYDWVVVGDHPGALLSGCLAAKMGFSVLFLGSARPPYQVVSSDGQFMDFESNFVLGVNAEFGRSLMVRMLGALNINVKDVYEVDGFEESLASPSLRMSLVRFDPKKPASLLGQLTAGAQGPEEFLEALMAVAPIEKEFATMAEKYFSETVQKKTKVTRWLSLETVLRKFSAKRKGALRGSLFASASPVDSLFLGGADCEFGALLKGWTYGLCGALDAESLIGFRAQDIASLVSASGTGRPAIGGITRMRSHFQGAAKRLAADSPFNAECRRIFVENGAIKGVQVSQRASMVSTRGLVFGGPNRLLRTLLSYSGKNFEKLWPNIQPSYWKFSISLMVRRDALPPGFGSRLIWIEPRGMPLEIELLGAQFSNQKGDPNYVSLLMRMPLPFSVESLDREFQRVMALRMYQKATEILPFLEYHTRVTYPYFQNDDIERAYEDLNGLYSFSTLDEIPDELRIYSPGTGVEQSGGIVEGLFEASGHILPRVGSGAWPLIAVESVSWLCAKMDVPHLVLN